MEFTGIKTIVVSSGGKLIAAENGAVEVWELP
jgi:hypothetical protein